MILLTDPLTLPNLRSKDLVLLQCEQCSSSFEKEKKEVIRVLRSLGNDHIKGRCKFCSKNCMFKYQTKRIETKCNLCLKILFKVKSEIGKTNFCSSTCNARYWNRFRKKPRNETCLECNSNLTKRHQNTFCSLRCQNNHQTKLKVSYWLLNPNSQNGKISLPNWIRNYVLAKANFKCSDISCGFSGTNPVTGNTIIHVDHIDGNPLNNRPDNLRALCPNCHAMTPTFGTINKNKGRRKLRQGSSNGRAGG